MCVGLGTPHRLVAVVLLIFDPPKGTAISFCGGGSSLVAILRVKREH